MSLLMMLLLPAMQLAGVLVMVVIELRMRRFLQEVPILQGAAEMAVFRDLAALNMYAALLTIGLLGGSWLLFFLLLYLKVLNMDFFLFMLLPAMLVMITGMIAKGTEGRVHALPTASEALTQERDHVIHVWLTQALPDWR